VTDGALLVRGAGRPGRAAPSSILVEDGVIRATGPEADTIAPPSARRLEADGFLAAPGFIELQVNGAAGHDLTADPGCLLQVAEALPRYGVTAFLPTLVSTFPEVHAAAFAALRVFPVRPPTGAATPLGLHIEGPFLSPDRPGVHDPAALRLPDPAMTAGWSLAAGVRLVTLAPELPGALELIRDLTARGIVVSAGHTAGEFDHGRAAIEAGVRYATHLFNAMTPLDHRAPGIALALLTDSRVTLGIIPDGVHVHPAMVDLVWRLAGAGRVSAVTDAIAALGKAPGRYRLGTADIEVDERSARAGDRLAGSVVGLDAAVRNLMAFTRASLAEALATVTAVPARLLGLADRGRLEPGTRADLVLLTARLEVGATIIGGRVAFAMEGLSGWD
jgi:N-acetylglucosamine-6-phosphate deacetylase